MPPKKKQVEDTRSPLEIAIAGTEDQIRQCEAQVQQFREGVHDLAVHTVKIKALESDIVPKEAELKTIMNNFNKLLENSVAVAKVRTSMDVDALASTMPARQPSRAASRAGAGTPLPPSQQPTEEANDREAMRHLAAVMREQLTAVIVPLFKLDRTQHEQQMEAARTREAAEAQVASAAAAATAAGTNAAQPQSAAAAAAAKPPPKTPTPAATPSKAGADKAPLSTLSVAELEEKVDLELFRPPGLDPHLYVDVLKLRTQRLNAERQLKSFQQQLAYSRQLVARRTNEGASKAALKKSEKTLSMLNTTLRDMTRQRDAHDTRKKSETPQPQGKAVGKAASVRK
jgi:hypothetical protein